MKFSGFMNVYLMDDNTWQYQYYDRKLKSDNLKDLEVLVSLYGLKWHVLDENLAEESLKFDKANRSGFLNVYKKGDYWCYRGTDLKSRSLQTLKKKALENSLKWEEADKDLAYKNWKLDSRK